jgi:hypothetical protein
MAFCTSQQEAILFWLDLFLPAGKLIAAFLKRDIAYFNNNSSVYLTCFNLSGFWLEGC